MFHILNNYRLKYGLDTIEKMISRWAPPVENHTEAYIDAVSKWSGVSRSTRLTTTNQDVMIPVVAAMIRMENGETVEQADIRAGWNLFIQNKR